MSTSKTSSVEPSRRRTREPDCARDGRRQRHRSRSSVRAGTNRLHRRARGQAARTARGRQAEAGSEAVALACDIRDPESVVALFAEVDSRFGRLDLLFNNAGIGAPAAPLEDVTLEQWSSVVETNLTGTFLCTQEAFRIMKRQSPARRPHHQQRLDLGERATPALGALHGDEARDHGPDQGHIPRRARYDIACGQIDIGNAATEMTEPMITTGVLQANGTDRERADNRCRRRRTGSRLHGNLAARRKRPVHDPDGDQDALHRSRLTPRGSRNSVRCGRRTVMWESAARKRRWAAGIRNDGGVSSHRSVGLMLLESSADRNRVLFVGPTRSFDQGRFSCHRSTSPSTASAARRTVEPRTLLADFLREGLGLTGTKVGCDTSQCGACTVHARRPRREVVHRARRPGRRRLGHHDRGPRRRGGLHPMQEAFWEHHGLQCGFCTPGMIMSAIDLVESDGEPDATPRSGTGSRATSAAAPATRTSSARSAPRPCDAVS